MKNKLFSSQSSYIVAWPIVVALFVLGILAAVKGWFLPASILLICAFVGLTARLWAIFSCKNLIISIKNDKCGLFPGGKLKTIIKMENGKFLPVMWLELNMRLDENPVLMPREAAVQDIEEAGAERDGKTIRYKSACAKLPSLIWYEKAEKTIEWDALRRGVYDCSDWSVISGDGLGLCQLKTGGAAAQGESIAVYPKLQEVSLGGFLGNIQNGRYGSKGLFEDVTVIRSSREYMPYDNSRSINWRLAARNMPLQVNLYERILPGNIHFIIDGESFQSPETYPEKLEDMLSIVASIAVKLADMGVDAGVTICSGKTSGPVHVFSMEHGLDEVLYGLSAYDPYEVDYQDDNKSVVLKTPDFGTERIQEMLPFIGRVYFVTKNGQSAASREEVMKIAPSKMSIITYEEAEIIGDYETLCLKAMKGGTSDDL